MLGKEGFTKYGILDICQFWESISIRFQKREEKSWIFVNIFTFCAAYLYMFYIFVNIFTLCAAIFVYICKYLKIFLPCALPQGGETHEGSQDRRAPTGKRKIVLIVIRIMVVISWHRDNETDDDDYEGGDWNLKCHEKHSNDISSILGNPLHRG